MLNPDKPVWVHRNVTRGDWSVLQDGLVVGHMPHLSLKDAKFIVRQGGYRQFVKTGRKNVHAFVRGMMVPYVWTGTETHIKYDPRLEPQFIAEDEPVTHAALVTFNETGLWGTL